MFAWLVLILLIAAEVAGVVWWLRKEYIPIFFNSWAALIYSAVLALDFVAAWLISTLDTPGGTPGLTLLMVLSLFLVVVVALMTLFMRWIVRQDMLEPPE
ncbi:MAG TPA: hypothetical protein VEW94_05785 [Chloroflexia bacterium]|nr:hypothetical protein [Chloroflexia bacterium]